MITKTQMNIILGMAKDIRDDACRAQQEFVLHENEEAIVMTRQQLDFSQRRLEVYLKGLVE